VQEAVWERTLLSAQPPRGGAESGPAFARRVGLHILRHTFCSHVAMRGAPAKAIQELAGHAELTTTMRYMHLSPGARQDPINLLNARKPDRIFGDILEPRIAASATRRDPS
jgi:integrase